MAHEVLQYIVIDDRESESKEIAHALKKANMPWVLVAHYLTLSDADSAIAETKLPGVHIAFVDGNLDKYSTGSYDGLMINHQLKTHAPHVVRVGNSASHEKPELSEIFINKYYNQPEILQEIERLARERLR